MTQYAMLGIRMVYNTMYLTDEEIRKSVGYGKDTRIERYNRCPMCECWTTESDKYRDEVACPAVQQAIAEGKIPN